MILKAEALKAQLADMQAKRDSFMQSYWQADGACQVIAGLLRILDQPEPNPPPAPDAPAATPETKKD